LPDHLFFKVWEVQLDAQGQFAIVAGSLLILAILSVWALRSR